MWRGALPLTDEGREDDTLQLLLIDHATCAHRDDCEVDISSLCAVVAVL